MIQINDQINLDTTEISESFSRSSGAGGQHVNKVETKVELRFNVKKSNALSKPVKLRLQKIAGRKCSQDGVVIITAEKYRLQSMNRDLARRKLKKLILRALEKPVLRLETKPSKAIKNRRATEKIKRSKVKLLRSRVRTE